MDIKQTFEEIYDRIKERIGSPFFGSAMLSWPFINYKFLITSLGDGKFIEKVYFIETYVYPDTMTRLCYMVGLPTLVGLLYTLAYPWLDTWLTVKSKELFARKQRKVLKAERKTPIDANEQAAFFASYDQNIKRLEAAFADQTKRHMDQFAESNRTLSDVTGRLRTQCLKRIADKTGLTVHHIEMLTSTEEFVLDQPSEPGALSVKTQARNSLLLKSLIPLIEQINQNTIPDSMGDRTANLPALAQVLNVNEADLLDSMELLQALGLVSLSGPGGLRTVGVAPEFTLERAIRNLRYIFAP